MRLRPSRAVVAAEERRAGVVVLAEFDRPGIAREACPAEPGAESGAGSPAGRLADSLAAARKWRAFERTCLVVQDGPRSRLAVAGFFSPAERASLDMLAWQLRHKLPTLRHVGYADAERDCIRLAGLLRERFGRAAEEGFQYVPMPRGGYIVLGMLAYALELGPDRLLGTGDPNAPLVVVDDCALSGARFRAFIARHPGRPLVFAHLYSPPALRDAILAAEPRVIACIGARDLRDDAPRLYGAEYAAWRERWQRRQGDQAYWAGQPEHLAFAWTEPEFSFWNPITDREEPGWPLVAPELCLKHRVGAGTEARMKLQRQQQGVGPLRPPAEVVFADLDEAIVINEVTSGENYILRDVAADMWRAILRTGEQERACLTLQEQYDVPGPVLREDLRIFTDELVARRLLEVDGEHGRSSPGA